MLDRFARLLEVSTTVAAMVLVLIVVQVGTQAFALVDLARRDEVKGGKKWLWALVIAFGNLPGAIAYLAAGRTVPSGAHSDSAAVAGEAARRAVDSLYGPRDKR